MAAFSDIETRCGNVGLERFEYRALSFYVFSHGTILLSYCLCSLVHYLRFQIAHPPSIRKRRVSRLCTVLSPASVGQLRFFLRTIQIRPITPYNVLIWATISTKDCIIATHDEIEKPFSSLTTQRMNRMLLSDILGRIPTTSSKQKMVNRLSPSCSSMPPRYRSLSWIWSCRRSMVLVCWKP